MVFNPDTARFEMESFFDVLFNPNAYSKFLHTVGSGYVTGAIFVITSYSIHYTKLYDNTMITIPTVIDLGIETKVLR